MTSTEETTGAFQRPRNLSQEVARFVEQKIVLLHYPPGGRLSEEGLCRELGVSRSPVREALRLLAADGLVTLAPNRGASVAPVSRRDLDEVCEARVPLEGIAAAGAARNRMPADLARLEAEFAAMAEAAGPRRDLEAAFHANVRLTDAIHEVSGNATVRRLLASVAKQALRYRYLSYRQAPGIVDLSVQANRRLLDAIRSGDAEAARQFAEALVTEAWRRLRGMVR